MVLAFFDFTFQPGGRAGRKVLQIKLSLELRRRRGIFGELLQIVPNGRMESRGRKVRGKRLTEEEPAPERPCGLCRGVSAYPAATGHHQGFPARSVLIGFAF